ncbi:YjjG family noncanonical pyrimidine nucleotidase [Paraclostridium sordellii]|uniref:YjjG family noncanonical pyrimidine nucleotidase n=1 Tax=Paraclostridium sordellii TaxID=1505 RepID=UPI001F051C5C|nr:YjjG family noncanonical pyrimidine nucleotidase [Paeniclostridium sordellii]MCH1965146.1 YjjG family noncanonical pyrimidine nucleotidase [Paeniclostridium sordellii]
MKQYKYLIFDLDDTLLDFQDNERNSLKVIFEKYNIPFEEKSINEYKAINRSFWSQIEQGTINKEEALNKRFEEFFALYGYNVQGEVIEKEYQNCLNKGHKTIPKAMETLMDLRIRGYKIFAGTNGVGKTQNQRLKDSKLIDFFDDVFISEEMGVEKPNSKFFEIIFNKYDFMKKEETLMIGDSLASDIKGANNFGIDSMWFNSLNKECGEIKPTYEIHELSEVLEVLNKEAVATV